MPTMFRKDVNAIRLKKYWFSSNQRIRNKTSHESKQQYVSFTKIKI
jgi:hypothetical protein